MSGPKVLLMIHGIGALFVWLWFIGSCGKEGMWNNAVTFLDAMLASFLAIPLWVLGTIITINALNPGSDDFYLIFAIVIGLGWVFYLLCFFVIHAITDRLSRTKVNFHPLADKIGSALFAMSLLGPIETFLYPVLVLVMIEAVNS